MCLLAVQYRLVPESPILIASNREEYFDRPTLPPAIQSGKPRALCGLDQRTSGTWLGVNQNGMFVGICNRMTRVPKAGERSRGLLGLDLLRCFTARKAYDKALDELSRTKYAGCSIVVADFSEGWVIYNEDNEPESRELPDGLSIIGARNLNDVGDDRVQMAHRLLTLQTLDSPVKFLAVASKVFARGPVANGKPGMVIRGQGYGTISSSLIALGVKPRDAIYQYASGAPDRAKYEDYSPMLRDILSRGIRENRAKSKVVKA